MSIRSFLTPVAGVGPRPSQRAARTTPGVRAEFEGRSKRYSKAFTLIELLVVVSIVALLISMLLPALGQARRAGKLAVCKSNLHQYAVATQSYATEHKEYLWSLSWKPEEVQNTQYPDLRGPLASPDNINQILQNEATAVANQAIDIIRRRTGRDNFPRIDGWIATVLYNHLALQDYLAQRLPEKMVVCPEDRPRLRWQTDPVNYLSLGERLPPGDQDSPRWPYSSSYRMVSNMWSNDRADRQHAWYLASAIGAGHSGPGSPGKSCIGTRRMNEVINPQQKVVMFDEATRHFGNIPFYWNYSDSRQPFLFFDGSARVRLTGDANPGAAVSTPGGAPFTYTYRPGAQTIMAPKRDGSYEGTAARFDKAYFMNATRGGLAGVDYGGEEIRVR